MIKNITVIDAVKTVNEALKIDKNAALIYKERVRIVEDRVGLEPEDFENLLYPFYYKKCGQFVSSAVEMLFFISNHIDPYLDNTKQENLVKVCRVAKNLEGDPIEYRESYGLAEKFSYEVNII